MTHTAASIVKIDNFFECFLYAIVLPISSRNYAILIGPGMFLAAVAAKRSEISELHFHPFFF